VVANGSLSIDQQHTKYTNTYRKGSQNTTVFVIDKVLVYIQMSQPTTCFGLF